MFEDMPHNLEAPHALGMTTVLVRSEANIDRPVQQMIRAWIEPPEHVHHMTHDLAGFLGRGRTPFRDAAQMRTGGERGLTPSSATKGG